MYWSQYLDGAGYSIANVRDSDGFSAADAIDGVGNSAANVEKLEPMPQMM